MTTVLRTERAEADSDPVSKQQVYWLGPRLTDNIAALPRSNEREATLSVRQMSLDPGKIDSAIDRHRHTLLDRPEARLQQSETDLRRCNGFKRLPDTGDRV